MQAVMSFDEVAGVVPSTITWREPVEVGQVRGGETGTSGASTGSPRGRESPAHGGHLSDGDTPATGKAHSRSRYYSGGSPGHGYTELTSSSSSPNLAVRDQDPVVSFTETTQIIGKQARLQEKPICVPVSESGMKPLVTDGVSPGSPQTSRQTIRSRARPRRSDEPAPFLSVDNLPVDKVIVEGKQHSKSRQSESRKLTSSTSKKRPDTLLNGTGRKTRSPPQSAYTSPLPRSPSRAQSRGTPSNTPYNYNSFFTHKSSAFLAGPPNLWSMGNKYWPQHGTPNDRQKLAPLPQSLAAEMLAPKPNTQVSQPFKHDTEAEAPVDRPVSPSQDLKERTIYALREVTRALNKQQDPPQSRRGGRLLKGRLKPLHTFKLAGPAIENCQGIKPEEGDHGPSDSRMLQRKRELLSMLPPDIFQPRPTTGESIHRTSIVSELSIDGEKEVEDEVREIEGRTEDQISSQVLSGAPMPPNSLASLSDINDASYLQDALTSHIDIPQSGSDNGAANDSQENSSDVQDDRSRGHQISEAYATSYESGSKIDLSSQQVEDSTAPGEPSTMVEKAEAEEDGSVKEEVKATMSDYMNEGGAARVLSDMVERVTNSAKKSTVEEDPNLDQKYDSYFGDAETRSETPTSRTGSSTLMRRRSSMDDIEMDQASCELTDMVSEDGLGEDGSLKQAESESSDRGSLSSLSKAKATNQNSNTEFQNKDATTAVTDRPKDTSANKNLDKNPPLDKIVEESHVSVENENQNSSLYTYIDSGVVQNVHNSTTDSRQDVSIDTNEDCKKEPASELIQNGIQDDREEEIRTESTDKNESSQNITESATGQEVSSIDAKPDAIAPESGVEDQTIGDSSKTSDMLNGVNDDTSSTLVTMDATANSTDAVPTFQIEVTAPESDIASEAPDTLSEQDMDAGHSTDTIVTKEQPKPAETDESEISTVEESVPDGQNETNSDDCDGERTGLPDEDNEKLTSKDDNSKDAQEDANNGCHNNGFRNDKDEDGSQGGQGGSHGNSSGSANGSGGGADTNGEGGNRNDQTDPPQGTDHSGTQRLSETTVDASADGESQSTSRAIKAVSTSNIFVEDNIKCGSYDDYEDDIPDIDEPVLFCGVCGLDEDMCLCPHSTFNEKLGSRGGRPSTKSASAVEYRRSQHSNVTDRSCSAVGGIGSSRENKEQLETWRQDVEIDGELIQRHLVLEYQAMIEKPRQKGFLSEELTSPRSGEAVHMLLQGTGVKYESRQSSAKRRPPSYSSEFEFRDHRTDHSEDALMSHDETRGLSYQLDNSMTSSGPMGDSGCWSEMQSEVNGGCQDSSTQSPPLQNGELSQDLNATSTVDKETTHQSRADADSLEIIAKPLSKPRQGNECRFPVGPIPAPLCFKINAKPPPGYLYYFAYGADMNNNRMSSYIGRQPDHRLWGILFGFKLTFNKRGADLEAGGFPNITFNPDSSVEGCVYLITPTELKMLDRHTGCPKFYTKAMFPVWMMNCAEPDELGVAQYCIPAVMYVAQDKWTLTQDEMQQIESDYSVGQCLKGSDLLTPSYIQHVSTLRVH